MSRCARRFFYAMTIHVSKKRADKITARKKS
nr:MAG TPA: hypothetical protein [Bacteriophage sp.]